MQHKSEEKKKLIHKFKRELEPSHFDQNIEIILLALIIFSYSTYQFSNKLPIISDLEQKLENNGCEPSKSKPILVSEKDGLQLPPPPAPPDLIKKSNNYFQPLTEIKGVRRVSQIELQKIIKLQPTFSPTFFLPLIVPSEKDKYRNSGPSVKGLNACYKKANQKKSTFKSWWKVSVLIDKKSSSKSKIPIWRNFYIITDDGYEFKAFIFKYYGNLLFLTMSDQTILGRWIKSRLVDVNLITPIDDVALDVERKGMITQEILKKYGCDCLVLSNTGMQKIDEKGDKRGIWFLSFKEKSSQPLDLNDQQLSKDNSNLQIESQPFKKFESSDTIQKHYEISHLNERFNENYNPLAESKGVKKVNHIDLQKIIQQPPKFNQTFSFPLVVPEEKDKFSLFGPAVTGLNVCYGRKFTSKHKKIDSQLWWKVCITTSQDNLWKKGFPLGYKKKYFYVITDDGFEFKAWIYKYLGEPRLQTIGGRKILGKWIKGRLVKAGLIRPVFNIASDKERKGVITKEILKEYGCQCLIFKNTGLYKLDEKGVKKEVWFLSFRGKNKKT